MSDLHINNIKSILGRLNYSSTFEIIPLPVSGSGRLYFRVKFKSNSNPSTIIVSYNDNISENIAQKSFTQHFKSLGFRVPEIILTDESLKYTIQHDLGDTSLFDLLSRDRNLAINLYQQVIEDLLNFQIEGIKNLDLEVAYPVKEFDEMTVKWDLNYFKYYFVKPHNISFNEHNLENDFNSFCNILLTSKSDFFNYRDFQSRNIMYNSDSLWYIDFQGGRKGPLQYDLVSLLYQVKANLDNNTRNKLLEYYLTKLALKLPGEQNNFMENYHNFVYFRLMQVMGAYGFRGLVQKKPHFLQSIGPAISLLKKLYLESPINNKLKELDYIFNQIINIEDYSENDHKTGLAVVVNSFSYKKKGIPIDFSGNGGGHVFDCRSLPNPGRIANLRDFTGLDNQIVEYLEDKDEVTFFIDNAYKIITQSVDNYIKRGFNNLQINFGCTGGKHRSVYSANTIGNKLKQKFPSITIQIHHNELH